MALSEYEKTQFANLTAGFIVNDTSALKKMEKHEKASAMSFVALPSLHVVLLVAAGISALSVIAGLISRNQIQASVSGAVAVMFIMFSMVLPDSGKKRVGVKPDEERSA